MLQQLGNQASQLAKIRQGTLVPVSETLVTWVRTPNSHPERSGWAGQLSQLSPTGSCIALLDDHADCPGLDVVHMRPGADEALQLAASSEQLESRMALGFSPSGASCKRYDSTAEASKPGTSSRARTTCRLRGGVIRWRSMSGQTRS